MDEVRADGDDDDEAGYSEDDHGEDEDGAASHSEDDHGEDEDGAAPLITFY
jgi:hypothetical protein